MMRTIKMLPGDVLFCRWLRPGHSADALDQVTVLFVVALPEFRNEVLTLYSASSMLRHINEYDLARLVEAGELSLEFVREGQYHVNRDGVYQVS